MEELKASSSTECQQLIQNLEEHVLPLFLQRENSIERQRRQWEWASTFEPLRPKSDSISTSQCTPPPLQSQMSSLNADKRARQRERRRQAEEKVLFCESV